MMQSNMERIDVRMQEALERLQPGKIESVDLADDQASSGTNVARCEVHIHAMLEAALNSLEDASCKVLEDIANRKEEMTQEMQDILLDVRRMREDVDEAVAASTGKVIANINDI